MIECPHCGYDHFWLRRGWVRHLARWLRLWPLRCRACYARVWRFSLYPPLSAAPMRAADRRPAPFAAPPPGSHWMMACAGA